MDVRLTEVTKVYGSVTALDQVSLEAKQGSIHALIGENGAGKTTLMRILYGAESPRSGTIEIDGKPTSFRNSADAIQAGIGMVSQHYSIIPELSCLENLMLGAEPGWFVDTRQATLRATELAKSMGYTFMWEEPAERLSPAGKQKLEILKLLWRNAKVMILDEPTAMLSPLDSDALFASLRRLADEGATIIVVTHRLPEVIDHCQTATVLRGGKLIKTIAVSETNANELAELIVGHSVTSHASSPPKLGEPRLLINKLSVKGYRGDEAVRGADLTLHKGEIVGLAGVDGNGQRELFQALVGNLSPSSGSISFDSIDWARFSTRQRISCGLRLIPEDRHTEGVIEEWNLIENAALGLQRLAPFARGGAMDNTACEAASERMAEKFNTKHGGLRNPMQSLSGGNQQRFVAARALDTSPGVVLAFQPTRGLDIDGTAQVYAALREACQQGCCALVVSFDLDELLENCDRVVAINLGTILSPSPGEEKSRQAIGRLMVGAA